MHGCCICESTLAKWTHFIWPLTSSKPMSILCTYSMGNWVYCMQGQAYGATLIRVKSWPWEVEYCFNTFENVGRTSSVSILSTSAFSFINTSSLKPLSSSFTVSDNENWGRPSSFLHSTWLLSKYWFRTASWIFPLVQSPSPRTGGNTSVSTGLGLTSNWVKFRIFCIKHKNKFFDSIRGSNGLLLEKFCIFGYIYTYTQYIHKDHTKTKNLTATHTENIEQAWRGLKCLAIFGKVFLSRYP